jgi:nicotinate phosphoribosyltransferase
MEAGKRTGTPESLTDIRSRVQSGLDELDRSYKRILNPHVFKVSLTEELKDLKVALMKGRLEHLD